MHQLRWEGERDVEWPQSIRRDPISSGRREAISASHGGVSKGHATDVAAINHATEHRTQIKTALSQAGIEPPELDGWTWDDERQKTRG